MQKKDEKEIPDGAVEKSKVPKQINLGELMNSKSDKSVKKQPIMASPPPKVVQPVNQSNQNKIDVILYVAGDQEDRMIVVEGYNKDTVMDICVDELISERIFNKDFNTICKKNNEPTRLKRLKTEFLALYKKADEDLESQVGSGDYGVRTNFFEGGVQSTDLGYYLRTEKEDILKTNSLTDLLMLKHSTKDVVDQIIKQTDRIEFHLKEPQGGAFLYLIT